VNRETRNLTAEGRFAIGCAAEHIEEASEDVGSNGYRERCTAAPNLRAATKAARRLEGNRSHAAPVEQLLNFEDDGIAVVGQHIESLEQAGRGFRYDCDIDNRATHARHVPISAIRCDLIHQACRSKQRTGTAGKRRAYKGRAIAGDINDRSAASAATGNRIRKVVPAFRISSTLPRSCFVRLTTSCIPSVLVFVKSRFEGKPIPSSLTSTSIWFGWAPRGIHGLFTESDDVEDDLPSAREPISQLQCDDLLIFDG